MEGTLLPLVLYKIRDPDIHPRNMGFEYVLEEFEKGDFIIEIYPWGTPFGGSQREQLGVNMIHTLWFMAQIMVIDMTGVNRSSIP